MSKEDREKIKATIRGLLERFGFDPTLPPPDFQAINEGTLAYFNTLNPALPLEFQRRANAYSVHMAKVTKLVYPRHSLPVQVRIGINLTYSFLIDDLGTSIGSEGILLFSQRLHLNQPQSSIVLDHFAIFFKEWFTNGHFGPYATGIFMKSCLDFLSGCYLENELEKDDAVLEIPSTATAFPRFFRMKTGWAEQVAHQIFPEDLLPEKKYLKEYIFIIPDVVDVIDYVNDVTSFYKESIVGNERTNLISTYARSHEVSPSEALKVFADKAVEAWERIFKSVRDEEVAKMVKESLMGYLTFEARLGRPDLDVALEPECQTGSVHSGYKAIFYTGSTLGINPGATEIVEGVSHRNRIRPRIYGTIAIYWILLATY
ncbi:hypothetical protein ABW19_dt0210603 [Dactylella cylindrospora]|nr:hypothetical protein ABW19_dt0210603 [Dactylella cylindrospora]